MRARDRRRAEAGRGAAVSAPAKPGDCYAQQLDAAGLDLAFWSRSWAESVGATDLCHLVSAELVSLYLDAGKTEAEFVAVMRQAFVSVKKARDALG